jgi:hypothetical protein
MALNDLTVYRPGKKNLPRFARLLQDNQKRLEQSVWGEDGHHKSSEVGVRYLERSQLSPLIRILTENETVVLEVSGNPALYCQLEGLLAEASSYRTFTRHSIVRFLVDQGLNLDYTC